MIPQYVTKKCASKPHFRGSFRTRGLCLVLLFLLIVIVLFFGGVFTSVKPVTYDTQHDVFEFKSKFEQFRSDNFNNTTADLYKQNAVKNVSKAVYLF